MQTPINNKENVIIFFIVIIALIFVILFNYRFLNKNSQKISAQQFINSLEELGYYKYAAPQDIEKIKEEQIKHFNPEKDFVTLWDEVEIPFDSYVVLDNGNLKTETQMRTISKDYRNYFLDGENLYEDGMAGKFRELQTTFEKIGLEINEIKENSSQDENGLDYSIIINDKEYIIFENFMSEDYQGWTEAPKKFAEIINEELQKQSKDEKVYLISGDHEGRLIFLTDDLFHFIDSVYTNPYWKPLPVEKWYQIMK